MLMLTAQQNFAMSLAKSLETKASIVHVVAVRSSLCLVIFLLLVFTFQRSACVPSAGGMTRSCCGQSAFLFYFFSHQQAVSLICI